MSGQGYVAVPPDSTGKKVDCVSLSVSGQTAYRQVIVLGSPTASAGYAAVTNGKLEVVANISGSAQVSVQNTVTVQGQVSVTGSVAVSNTVTVQGNVSATIIGSLPNINISALPAVNVSSMPAVSLAAGTNNIGTINGISASVTVQGNVNISSMPAVNISSMPNVTIGNNLNISALPAVNISSMPAVNVNAISASVRTYQGPLAVPSASHGPKVAAVSTSVGVALVAAPGASLSIYVDQVMVTNGGTSLARLDIFDASNTAAPVVSGFCAPQGGGFVVTFNPPAKISANTALNMRCDPNASGDVLVNINFHVEN